jgi:Zn-finger nucleic acid-binding protein
MNPATSKPKPATEMKLVCMDCTEELEGSNPQGTQISHGLCPKCFGVRMAEIQKEVA